MISVYWARLVEKQNGATVSDKRFVWCGLELCEERDGSGSVVNKRFYPEGAQIGGVNYRFTRDHLGSIREVLDDSDNIRARYDYDPYGRRTKVSGDLDADFGFSGHYYHALSGLHLAPYRSYDPDTGRWLRRDPLGEAGGMNLYAYVFNDPVNEVDPFGLAVGDWWDPGTYWNEGFLEGWSKGGQGVINAFTGGLFWPEYGLFYDTFDEQWKDLGTDGTKDDSAFKFGNNGGRVAVACLAGAGALSRTAIGNANMGWKGGEITFTRPGAPTPDWRINPFGGSGYPPHYHRRPGIGQHRPWDGGW